MAVVGQHHLTHNSQCREGGIGVVGGERADCQSSCFEAGRSGKPCRKESWVFVSPS